MDNLDFTHDAGRVSWLEAANGVLAEFPLQNLPLGVFRLAGEGPGRARGGVAIGDQVLDLAAAVALDLFEGAALAAARAASGATLNPLMAMGGGAASALRAALSRLLGAEAPQAVRDRVAQALVPQDAVVMELPARIGGFTDFFTSAHHAARAGRISRPHQPLPPAFKQLPMAYNSRASTVRVSGADLTRPWGILQAAADADYRFGPAEALDFELEVGAYVGRGNDGAMIPIDAARDHLFGFCLVNDWSSRDIQRAEIFPLGPFLAKSTMTSVSPWVVTADALAPFRSPANAEAGDVPVPAHLDSPRHRGEGAFAVSLTASLSTEAMRAAGEPEALLTRTDLRNLYWTFEQMLAHHASNGCTLEPGDLIGSGTVSGPEQSAAACLYELCIVPDAARFEDLTLPNGERRRWLHDGDEIVLRGWAERPGFRRIGFGECRARIRPAQAYPGN